MVAQKLRTTCDAAFLFQLGEKIRHGPGIKAGVIHDVGAQQVGFGFRFARVLQEVRADPKRKPHLRHLRECALAHDSTQNCQRKLRCHLLARRPRAVALHHVGNFVGDHACQLGFVVRRLNGSQIYKNRPTRKRKGVNFFLIHYVKLYGHFSPGAWAASWLPAAARKS